MKKFIPRHKTLTAVVAAALALVIMLGGTFAWQSINQTALNEVYATRNPGGRLHDDFNEVTDDIGAVNMTFDKNVYVENFTTMADNGSQIFARVRLDEYMEIGPGAGLTEGNEAVSLVYGAELAKKETWTTHIPGNPDDPFHQYWTWTTGGAATYMPTFNKNRDSLEADINGTFNNQFTDYTGYAQGDTAEDLAIYDNDQNAEDEMELYDWDVATAENNGHIRTENETHTAKETLNATILTMEQWLELPEDQKTGDFWVWDADGWAYWANPINPDTATGLLLDAIERTDVLIDEDWYYAINVVGQFITKEDMGKENGTGFYDTEAGKAPSSNALRLLHAIGVEVRETVSAPDQLTAALDIGGVTAISGEINGDTQVLPWGEEYPQFVGEYLMSEGGTITGYKDTGDTQTEDKLILDGAREFGLVIRNTETQKASALRDLTIEGNSEALVYISSNNQKVTLTNVTVNANGGTGIYGEFAKNGIVLTDCTVKQTGLREGNESWFNTAVAAAQGTKMTINGGHYESANGWAVYCFQGDNQEPTEITINAGTFIGKLQAANNDKIIIKGGSFSVDPTAYLAEGYTATLDTDSGLWIVR